LKGRGGTELKLRTNLNCPAAKKKQEPGKPDVERNGGCGRKGKGTTILEVKKRGD